MNLKGLRVRIRAFRSSDAEDFFAFAKDPRVGPNAGWRPHRDVFDTQRIISSYIYSNETFAIELINESKVIGSISLYEETFRKRVKAYELGFTLSPSYESNGYMAEAVNLMLDYAFRVLRAEVVMTGHYVGNVKSERVIRRAGFVYEGTFRKYRRTYDGVLVDAVMYSMLEVDYERKRYSWKKN